MKFTPTAIPDVVLIAPNVFKDGRGFFFESYQRELFSKHGIASEFVQDNHSRSARGTLRGLHYQIAPREQAKLIRVVRGKIYDVAVDIRKKSKTFGKYVAVDLSAEDQTMLYVPAGFAHGFLALEDETEVLYKVTDIYSKAHERGIRWDDQTLGIPWPKIGVEPVLSDKDKVFPAFNEISF